MTLGAPEVLILLLILLVLFGSARLPRLARALGDSLRELRRSTAAGEDES